MVSLSISGRKMSNNKTHGIRKETAQLKKIHIIILFLIFLPSPNPAEILLQKKMNYYRIIKDFWLLLGKGRQYFYFLFGIAFKKRISRCHFD